MTCELESEVQARSVRSPRTPGVLVHLLREPRGAHDEVRELRRELPGAPRELLLLLLLAQLLQRRHLPRTQRRNSSEVDLRDHWAWRARV